MADPKCHVATPPKTVLQGAAEWHYVKAFQFVAGRIGGVRTDRRECQNSYRNPGFDEKFKLWNRADKAASFQ